MAQPLIAITFRHALTFAFFLVLYEFLTYIANDMVMPGMLMVVHHFKATEGAVATSLTAYILGGASLQLFLGPLSDYYGRRPVMLFGSAFFFICTILIACSQSIEQFLFIRFFQGMGLCFIGVIGYATLQEIFDEMDAIRLVSVMANVATIAPLIGPLAGAWFFVYFGWRTLFLIIAVLSLIAFWGLWMWMPEAVGQKKHDGSYIKRIPLTFKIVLKNYLSLFANPAFIFGCIGLGLINAVCIVWIALAPVILISDARLTVVEYAYWQIPLFGALIIGTCILQRLTSYGNVSQLTLWGSIIVGVGLILTYIFPYFISPKFIWLMPGLIIYFFGLGVASAPLNRLILFLTPVAKGTASALMSMINMCIIAITIELGSSIYRDHDNIIFSFYCALIGVVYFLTLWMCFYFKMKDYRLDSTGNID